MPTRAPIKALPSQSQLRSLFEYDRATGTLTWRRKPGTSKRDYAFNNKCGGKPAGTIGANHGYRVIGLRLNGYEAGATYYYAHRIIWKMMTGCDPVDQIDHRDGDRANNRWLNLRPADNGKNRHNAKRAKNNRSSVKGVCWEPSHKAWKAYIGINGKQFQLGRFKSLAAACAARKAAADKLHGDFSRAA